MFSYVKNRIKRRILRNLGIHYNPFGVPFSLAKHLEGRTEISMIDVGAHRGTFTAAVDRLCSVSRGILIEAQPGLADELRASFPEPRFRVVSAVASDHPGTMQLNINGSDMTTSIFEPRRDLPQLAGLDLRPNAVAQCEVLPLDEIMRQEQRLDIDLLKLDVQGAELLVVRGAAHTLARTRWVWTEVSFLRLYEGACLFPDLQEELVNAGFRLMEIEAGWRPPGGELVQADVLFAKP